MGEQLGRKILAIAVRTEKKGPMRETDRVSATPDDGLEGDLPAAAHRRITLLSNEQWSETTRELNAELPWHTRRVPLHLMRGMLVAGSALLFMYALRDLPLALCTSISFAASRAISGVVAATAATA